MLGEDSDNDQGFSPARHQILANRLSRIQDISDKQRQNQRPKDFLTRYIYGEGIMRYFVNNERKQPEEAYNTNSTILEKQSGNLDDSVRVQMKPKQKTIRQQPYAKYFCSSQYTLVYSRFRNKPSEGFDGKTFCRNQVNLKVLSEYKQQSFSLLKNFVVKDELDESSTLEFDSRFECGNLLWAFVHNNTAHQYTLFIQNDTNTYGYNQWFYFSIQNGRPGVSYKFHIVNFRKKHSFFKEGKKLAIFSYKQASENGGSGWSYGGQNISYERAPIQLEDNLVKFYELSFELEVEQERDLVMVAMNLPYSYTKLMTRLKVLEKKAVQQQINWQMTPIAHSIANNAVPYLTITSPQQQTKKKTIVFLARQHPGQTWSSYLMEEILQQLLNQTQSSQWILSNFIIKVFPMVNVDGVIYGNFRCDLGGVDLNRKWRQPSTILHPQIYAIRDQIERLQTTSDQGILSCFDLHGHSKAYNVFCYSCKTNNYDCRVLPYLFSQLNQAFHFPSCTFGVTKAKKKTARAVIFQIIKNPNVLTIECSFYGKRSIQSLSASSFQPKIMRELAKSMLQGMKIYYNNQPRSLQIAETVKQNISSLLQYQRVNNDDAGSESDPSADEMDIIDKIGTIIPNKIMTLDPEINIQKRKKIKKKKLFKEKGLATFIKKFQTVDKTKQTKAEQQETPSEKKLDRSQVFYPRSTTYKKSPTIYNQSRKESFRQEPKKKQSIDIMEARPPNFSLEQNKRQTQTKLPFYIREETRLIPLRFKHQMAQDHLREAYQRQRQCHINAKFSCFRVSAYKTNQRCKSKGIDTLGEEQLPSLCVLSENKKKQQIDRMKSRSKQPKNYKPVNKEELIIGSKKHHMKFKYELPRGSKNKDKSMQFLTKIWRQNYTRYGKELKTINNNVKL